MGTSEERSEALSCLKLGYGSGIDNGDSGEELGEISGTVGESNVEIVVVGEESDDPVVIDETLWRCWKGSRCFELFAEALLEAPRGRFSLLSSSLSEICDEMSPKTDMNDGKESGMDGGLVCTGMAQNLGDVRV